jgi:hypothetical protein
MYRVRSTGEVLSQGQVRNLHKNTSFPKTWTPEIIEELGLDPVFETPAPTITHYQTAFKDGVEQVDGKWVWKWAIGPVFTDFTNEDGAVVTAAEQEAAYKARIDDEAAKNVRATRDRLIAETDWIVIKNLELNQNVPGKWEVYRQDLRDVPSQANFPHDITWPVKPT